MIKLKSILLNELNSMESPINDRLRIHWSPVLIKNLVDKTDIQTDRPISKPFGFWYGFGREWIQFVYSHQSLFDMKYKGGGNYLYFVKIKDPNKILHITNFEELWKFTKKYEIQPGNLNFSYFERGWVNWKNVAKDYCGIEINPKQKEFHEIIKWYDYWDIASGCVWNPSILELKLIYPKPTKQL